MNIYAVWNWRSTIVPIALAAVCVWLGVRIVNRRERWAKRLAAGIACLPFLYVLSFGPACWLIAYIGVAPPQPNPPTRALDWIAMIYAPCGQIDRYTGEHGPAFIEQSLNWYAGVGIPQGKPVLIPASPHMWLVGRDDTHYDDPAVQKWLSDDFEEVMNRAVNSTPNPDATPEID